MYTVSDNGIIIKHVSNVKDGSLAKLCTNSEERTRLCIVRI
jgi:hypothetical protein